MKRIIPALILVLAVVSAANPGDTIRNYIIPGMPGMGILGLAKDWETGNIWIGGADGSNNSRFAAMDPVTLDIVTSWVTYTDVYWGFDIGYGYEAGGKKYLVMTDQQSPFLKLIDPVDGSYDGSLPDYYAADDITEGCAVDWNTNNVYLCSYYDSDCVYYNGSSYNVFSSTGDGRFKGSAVGWGHIFLLRNGPYFDIDVYDLASGAFEESISMSGFAGNSLIGLACGRENAAGDNESMFLFATQYEVLYEIEVGDYVSGSSLERMTWGGIKSGF